MSKRQLKNIPGESFESQFPNLPEHRLLQRFFNETDKNSKNIILTTLICFADQSLNHRWSRPIDNLLPVKLFPEFGSLPINFDYVLAKISLNQSKINTDSPFQLDKDALIFSIYHISYIAGFLENLLLADRFIAKKWALATFYASKPCWINLMVEQQELFGAYSSLKKEVFSEIFSTPKSFREDIPTIVKDFEDKHNHSLSSNFNLKAFARKRKAVFDNYNKNKKAASGQYR